MIDTINELKTNLDNPEVCSDINCLKNYGNCWVKGYHRYKNHKSPLLRIFCSNVYLPEHLKLITRENFFHNCILLIK